MAANFGHAEFILTKRMKTQPLVYEIAQRTRETSICSKENRAPATAPITNVEGVIRSVTSIKIVLERRGLQLEMVLSSAIQRMAIGSGVNW